MLEVQTREGQSSAMLGLQMEYAYGCNQLWPDPGDKCALTLLQSAFTHFQRSRQNIAGHCAQG